MAEAANGAAPALALPGELWAQVLGNLAGDDLGRALCTCKTFASLSSSAWQRACCRRWPRWAALAAEPGAEWRRQYELLGLRELSESCAIDTAKVRAAQDIITERHRMILAEWLCEVAFDWNLETTLVFKAMRYLDNYMTTNTVSELGRLQLLGLACLRAAMGDARKPTSLMHGEGGVKAAPGSSGPPDYSGLEAARFAHVSNDAYSAEEVEEVTLEVAATVPPALKVSPNAKMFLRSFWYRACVKDVVCGEEMHIYTTAGFLLQLSLLDLDFSGLPASLAAAASLAASLAFFGKTAWRPELVRFGSYEAHELAPAAARLWRLQGALEAPQLRSAWRQRYSRHGYDEYRAEWEAALSVFGTKGAGWGENGVAGNGARGSDGAGQVPSRDRADSDDPALDGRPDAEDMAVDASTTLAAATPRRMATRSTAGRLAPG